MALASLIPAPEAPPVRHGQTLDYEGLLAGANAAVDPCGQTRIELAERLYVAQSTLSSALNKAGGLAPRLQRGIIAEFTFCVQRKEGEV